MATQAPTVTDPTLYYLCRDREDPLTVCYRVVRETPTYVWVQSIERHFARVGPVEKRFRETLGHVRVETDVVNSAIAANAHRRAVMRAAYTELQVALKKIEANASITAAQQCVTHEHTATMLCAARLANALAQLF